MRDLDAPKPKWHYFRLTTLCYFLFSGILLNTQGCGPQKITTRSSAPLNATPQTAAQGSGALQTVTTIGNLGVPTEIDKIHDENVIQRWKNQIIFLNSTALEKAYCPLFCQASECALPATARSTCRPRWRGNLANSSYFKNNPSAFFSESERVSLGDYKISKYDPQFNRMRWMSSITQDYIQTLRLFLGDACQQIITSESEAAVYDNNFLVKGPAPTVNNINEIMTKFFGYKPLLGVHVGAEKYHQVYLNSMTEPPPSSAADRDQRMKTNYLLLCVAIGSDPRVYSR